MHQGNILSDKIETLMHSYSTNEHELLHEKVLAELATLNYRAISVELADLPLFRIRLNEKDNQYFSKLSDLKYAPPNRVSEFGRVNRPGQSMLYCSEEPTICILESLHDYLHKNSIGHERIITCATWKIEKKLNLLVLAIPESEREISNSFTIRDQCVQFIKTTSTFDQVNYDNLYTLTNRFFLKNAKSSRSVYVVCSAIANYLTLQMPEIDGFIYPTVQGNTGYNIVLRPHVVDAKMIIPTVVNMEKWIITENTKMLIESAFTLTGAINGEKIEWNIDN